MILHCTQHINDRWQLSLILLLLKKQLWNELLFPVLIPFILRGESNARMDWCIEVESICAGKPSSHSLNAFILSKMELYLAVAWHVAPVVVLK